MILNVINSVITKKFKIRITDLKGKSRKRHICLPRQIAIHFVKKKTKLLLYQIGKEYNRDHSTVINSLTTVQNLIDTDAIFYEMIIDIENEIELNLNIEYQGEMNQMDKDIEFLDNKRADEPGTGLL
jgi:hypothetical protein